MQTVAARWCGRGAAGPPRPAGARCRGPAGDRAAAPSALPGRAVSAAPRVHRRAPAPHPGGPDRRRGPAVRPLRRAVRARRRARRARRRSSRTAWGASLTARSRSCAGRSATFGFHLASLEIRQHSAVHDARWRCWLRPRRRRRTRARDGGRAGRVAGRGPGHVPGDGRRPGAVRRGRLPRYVVSFTAGRGRPAVLDARRGSPSGRDRRVRPPSTSCRCSSRRRARSRRADPRRPAPRPDLPRPPRGAGRPPGGDARLLRLEQGVRVPRGELDALPGPGGARRASPGVMASS